jgi:hypothetical protein
MGDRKGLGRHALRIRTRRRALVHPAQPERRGHSGRHPDGRKPDPKQNPRGLRP